MKMSSVSLLFFFSCVGIGRRPAVECGRGWRWRRGCSKEEDEIIFLKKKKVEKMEKPNEKSSKEEQREWMSTRVQRLAQITEQTKGGGGRGRGLLRRAILLGIRCAPAPSA